MYQPPRDLPNNSTHYHRLALFFVVLQIIVLTEYTGKTAEPWPLLFWYCNHISLLYAIAFYYRRIQMVFGLMQVGIVIQFLWLIDVVGKLFGVTLFGMTDYLFTGPFTHIKIATLILHITIPLLAMTVFLRMPPPKPTSLLYSFAYIGAMYVLTLTFTPANDNVNCAFIPCLHFIPSWHYHPLIIVYTAMLAFSTYLVLRRFFLVHQPTL